MTYKTHKKTFPNSSKKKTESVLKSNWWTPVWRGLVVEPSGKHFKGMGSAVWLYLYFLMYANRGTGTLFRRIATIAGDIGMSTRTVSRWLNILKTGGYVDVRQTGRSLQISVTKWKSIKKK
jgi:hypothetical protein